MKSFFDQIESIFGIRIDRFFPYIVAVVAIAMFLNLKHQIAQLTAEIEDVRSAQNSVSSLSRADIAPISQSVNLANDRLSKLLTQSAYISERLPEIENAVGLANQKLTYVENQKTVPVDVSKPH